jgi:hypothetical protein
MQTGADPESEKKAAEEFLKGLKEHLKLTVHSQEVTEWIQQNEQAAIEWRFLDKFVLPSIHKYLGKAIDQPTAERSRQAFLAESIAARKNLWTSDSPRSAKKHLFTKDWADPRSVIKSWWDETAKKGLTSQSCPDWAFRAPCPHTVVFEAKLFRDGGIERARSELVTGIYQCFYYRAHPEMQETKTHPAWKYDYACLFAYDASKNQSLAKVWESLNKTVKAVCWDSANIFVMVLSNEMK